MAGAGAVVAVGGLGVVDAHFVGGDPFGGAVEVGTVVAFDQWEEIIVEEVGGVALEADVAVHAVIVGGFAFGGVDGGDIADHDVFRLIDGETEESGFSGFGEGLVDADTFASITAVVVGHAHGDGVVDIEEGLADLRLFFGVVAVPVAVLILGTGADGLFLFEAVIEEGVYRWGGDGPRFEDEAESPGDEDGVRAVVIVFHGVGMNGDAELSGVGCALHLLCGTAGHGEHGADQCDEQGDDADGDDEFDQAKASGVVRVARVA